MLIVSAGFTVVHTSTALATDTEPIAAPSTTKSESSIQLSDYTARYTGKAVAYGGDIERTGSTGAVVYSYFSDAACTEEVVASEVVNAGTYYVTASLLSDSNYEAATSAVAVMTIDADLTPVVNPEETTTYSSWDDVPANTYEKETLSFDFNGQTIYGVAYIPQLEMENYSLVICCHGINGMWYRSTIQIMRRKSIATSIISSSRGQDTASLGRTASRPISTSLTI